MKFATLRNKSRDGELVLVSADHENATEVKDIAPTLQYVLDNWETTTPLLEQRYALLNSGKLPDAFNFSQNSTTGSAFP